MTNQPEEHMHVAEVHETTGEEKALDGYDANDVHNNVGEEVEEDEDGL